MSYEDLRKSARISSLSRVNGLVGLHEVVLRPLADAMLARWEKIRQQAVDVLVDSLRHPRDPVKRKALYKHIASSQIPTVELVIALRNHLLVHRHLSDSTAKSIVVAHQPDPTVSKEVLDAVSNEMLQETETLIDIAKGIGYDTDTKQTDDSNSKKVALSSEDKLDYGWLAVDKRLVLIEIGAFKDIERPCAFCKKNKASKRCSRCHVEFYCDKTCQTNHWDQHKLQCNPTHKQTLQELRTCLTQDFLPIVITCNDK
jgi:hypothetical protein